MHFQFKSDTFQPIKKFFSFTFPDFLGNVGGFMGLFAGISILSIIEVFYHFVGAFKQKMIIEVKPFLIVPPKIALVDQDHVLVQLVKYFVKFIKTTDMHGAHYMMDSSLSQSSRIFWLVSLGPSVGLCVYSVGGMLRHAEKNPVAVRIDSRGELKFKLKSSSKILASFRFLSQLSSLA